MSAATPLSLELNDLSAALQRVNQRLQSAPMPDLLALNEFRHHLDNVRLTAWMVSELINAESIKKDPDKVLAFIFADRLRRMEHSIRELCGDLERRVITPRTHGMRSLFDSIKLFEQTVVQSIAGERTNQAGNAHAAISGS